MSIATLLLTIVALLIFSGVLERVLDRMYLTDRSALILTALMFIGTLLPNIDLGPVAISLGGGLIPLCVCIWLLVKADTGRERLHALGGTLITAGLILACSMLLPEEPEQIPVEPMLLYGIAGGVAACLFGRSRRNAFLCGVLGMMLADVITAIMNWSKGIDQQLILGGAGMADAVVISGVLAVLLAELVGEIRERVSRSSGGKDGEDQ